MALAIALVFRAPLTGLLRREEAAISAPGGFSVSAKGMQVAKEELVEAARSRPDATMAPEDAEKTVAAAAQGVEGLGRHPRVLWVDDRPSNNRHEVSALNALGMHVAFSGSTDDALRRLEGGGGYDLVISDMSRPGDRKAGYTLLAKLRRRGSRVPYLIYAASRSASDFDEAVRRGAHGCTNRPDELVQLVTNALWGAGHTTGR